MAGPIPDPSVREEPWLVNSDADQLAADKTSRALDSQGLMGGNGDVSRENRGVLLKAGPVILAERKNLSKKTGVCVEAETGALRRKLALNVIQGSLRSAGCSAEGLTHRNMGCFCLTYTVT